MAERNDSYAEPGAPDPAGLGVRHTYPAGHHDHDLPEGVEPDFTHNLGATEPWEAAEEGEPYFPPTDPVVRPAPVTRGGLEIVGGFSATAMDEVGVEGEPRGRVPDDEQIRAAVLQDLREEALTTDLRIRVAVHHGVVYLRGSVPSLEDAEAAEEVAARVEGVAEVVDELEVESLSRP